MKSCSVPAGYILPLFKHLTLLWSSGVPWRRGCLCGAASGCKGWLDPGPDLLLPKCQSPALRVFHMRHDTPQRVWFSQKWEDLAGQSRNVKGLMTDSFFSSVLRGRVCNIFLPCSLKGWASFASYKASLWLTRDIIFRCQCPISDSGSKGSYIHLCV